MPIKSEVYEFFVEGKNSHLSHVLLHIASPGKPDSEAQGYFFVLTEIDHPDAEILGIIEELISDGETLYYSGYDGETKNYPDPEAKHFESVVEKLNRKARMLLNNGIDRPINMAVGIINGNKLSFAYRGEIIAILAYVTGEGPSFTKIIDEASHPEHMFFSSVVEGNFTTEEAVYLSTPHVLKYFSFDRIAKMIVEKPAKSSAHQIQRTLESISSEYSFGGIVLTSVETAEIVKREKPVYKPTIGSEASMEKLYDTTKSTEETLSPKVFSHLAQSLRGSIRRDESDEESQFQSTVRETNNGKYRKKRKPFSPNTNNSIISSILIVVGKILVWITKALYYAIKNILIALGKLVAIIWCLISNYNGNRKNLIESYKTWWRNLVDRFTGLGIFGKLLLLAVIVGIGILTSSILYTKQKQKEAAREADYQNHITEVDEKRKEAETDILYGETKKALELVRGAEDELNSLTHDTEEKKKHAEEIHTQLASLLLKVQKMNQITPEKVTSITETESSAKTDSLVLVGDTLIATGKTDTSLYLISTLTGSVEKKSAETAGPLGNGYVSKDGLQVVFISGANAIVAYDTATQSLISKTITFPNQGVSLSDIGLYNGRLYALDSANGAIYRHNPTQVGYDGGTNWIKTMSDPNILRDGVSFGIDGDMFILTSKGTIIKLTSGEEQSFEVTGLDPVFTSPTQIETNSEFKNLYILEPSRKRIVVIDKQGNFKKQFSSDVWQNPTSISISADEKTAYILDGTTVYKFKL